jgi:hypothetical protein
VGQEDDTHDRISNIRDTVKDKWQDERPVSERCAVNGAAVGYGLYRQKCRQPEDKEHCSRSVTESGMGLCV